MFEIHSEGRIEDRRSVFGNLCWEAEGSVEFAYLRDILCEHTELEND